MRWVVKKFTIQNRFEGMTQNCCALINCHYQPDLRYVCVVSLRARISDYIWKIPYLNHMPRRARIDATGALHHIVMRGIERKALFKDDTDREDFIERLSGLPQEMDADAIGRHRSVRGYRRCVPLYWHRRVMKWPAGLIQTARPSAGRAKG